VQLSVAHLPLSHLDHADVVLRVVALICRPARPLNNLSRAHLSVSSMRFLALFLFGGAYGGDIRFRQFFMPACLVHDDEAVVVVLLHLTGYPVQVLLKEKCRLPPEPINGDSFGAHLLVQSGPAHQQANKFIAAGRRGRHAQLCHCLRVSLIKADPCLSVLLAVD